MHMLLQDWAETRHISQVKFKIKSEWISHDNYLAFTSGVDYKKKSSDAHNTVWPSEILWHTNDTTLTLDDINDTTDDDRAKNGRNGGIDSVADRGCDSGVECVSNGGY